MTRPTVRALITQDLGYCCVWWFFMRYRRPTMIADRLGMSVRAVQNVRSSVERGECECENSPRCMKRFLKRPRAIP